MEAAYRTFTLLWSERELEVRYRPNWLNTGYCHIELRCSDRLPVTETGYRSTFVPAVKFAEDCRVRAYVDGWLNEAALQPAWQRYLENSRQLKLL